MTCRVTKDGALITVSVTVSPVVDAHGKITGGAAIMRDISERKRRAREINALHQLNLAITSTLDLPIILQLLLQKVDILLPYAAAHIRLINPATGALEPLAWRNIDEKKLKARQSRATARSPGKSWAPR